MRRRSFLATIAALVLAPACALKARQKPDLGMIMGYVFRRQGVLKWGTGLARARFGAAPDQRQPNVPILLHQLRPDYKYELVGKTISNSDGWFEFKNLQPGIYYVQVVGGYTHPVALVGNAKKYVGAYQYP